MLHRTVAAALGLALVWTACASERAELGPYNELDGDVGPGGFGGTPVLNAVNSGVGGEAGTSVVVASSAAAGGAGGGCVNGGIEPNESESAAPLVASVNDCDSNAFVLQGVLAGNADVDWYRYTGSDVFGCVVDPTRELSAGGPVRLCKYAECNEGPNTAVTCNGGAVADTSFQGRPGCCHNTGFDMDVECDGADDDATIYLLIEQTGDACINYSLELHY